MIFGDSGVGLIVILVLILCVVFGDEICFGFGGFCKSGDMISWFVFNIIGFVL